VFELRDQDKVELQPGAPPANWILPWVQFGKRRDVADVMRRVLFENARLAARPTPEIEALAAETCAGLDGDEAKARALLAKVTSIVKQPNPRSAASAVATLLQEEGNPVHLYSALLTAARIEHDLVWSTDVSPECDPDQGLPFPDLARFGKRLLVRVRPKGAAVAWCDLSMRGLPYGELLGNAPRAEALTSEGVVHLPDLPLEERAGSKVSMQLAVHDDGGADATLRIESTGNAGFAGKDRFKEIPVAQRKAALGQAFARLLPGFELAELELPGLDGDGPLVLVGKGRVRKLLDANGDGWTLKLPVPALSLGAGLAGGEGERLSSLFAIAGIGGFLGLLIGLTTARSGRYARDGGWGGFGGGGWGGGGGFGGGGAQSPPGWICAFVRKVLSFCQLLAGVFGIVPSSRTLLTWYACWFQMRRVGIQRFCASCSTSTVCTYMPALLFETTTMSAELSLSTSATTGYSMSVPELRALLRFCMPVLPSRTSSET